MSRRSKDPAYRLHRQSGQAIVSIPTGFGGRRDFLLGKHGSKESKERYHRLLADWRANEGRLPAAGQPGELSINEIILAFWNHAKTHYAKTSREPMSFRLAFRTVKKMYGNLPIKDFGPRCLKVLQRVMADGSWMTEGEKERYRKNGWQIGMARNTVNRQIIRVRTWIKWAESEELAPKGTYHALQTVTGLPINSPNVRHTKRVGPATWEQVCKIVTQAKPVIGTMLQLQWWAGMRSCEVRLMRFADINRSNPQCWLYRPSSHKNAWRGQERVVPLGPRCIELLQPYLFKGQAEPEEYLFTPHKTGACYSAFAYSQAVRRPAERAGLVGFHPYMTRHGCKQRIESEAGTDAARCVLGHKSIITTTHYGKLDVDRATTIMSKIG